jgi:hypothetical protein
MVQAGADSSAVLDDLEPRCHQVLDMIASGESDQAAEFGSAVLAQVGRQVLLWLPAA